MNISKVASISIIQAEQLIAADKSGTSDPYIELNFSGEIPQTYTTRIIDKTLSPKWDEKVNFYLTESDVSQKKKLEFLVFDHDEWSKDDSLGKLTLPLFSAEQNWYPLEGVKTGKIELILSIRDFGADEEPEIFLREPKEAVKKQPRERGFSYFPLKGSTFPPTALVDQQANPETPPKSLVLDHVYGYRGYDSTDNLFQNADGHLVYPMAAVGIVIDPKTRNQRFFREHEDDIVALTLHPNGDVVASGQVASLKSGARQPKIYVWSSKNPEKKALAVIQGFHKRSIACLEFSKDGEFLISVGMDDKHSVLISDWKKGTELYSSYGGSQIINVCKRIPYEENSFVTAGVKHLRIWTATASAEQNSQTRSTSKKPAKDALSFEHKDGRFGKFPIQTISGIAFGKDVLFSATLSGDIYAWKGTQVLYNLDACKGNTVYSLLFTGSTLLAGTKNGKLIIFEKTGEEQEFSSSNTQAIELDSNPALDTWNVDEVHRGIKSLTGNIDQLYLGTSRGEIISIQNKTDILSVTQGHWNELWGCSTHPKRPIAATSGNDKSLRVWDLENKKQIRNIQLEDSASCLDFNALGNFMTVGLKNGTVVIVPSSRTEKSIEISVGDKSVRVLDIKFSPAGDRIAAGLSNGHIVILQNDPQSKSWKQIGTCKGHSAAVIHLDWSEDGSLLQSDSASYEHLYWECEDLEQVTKSIGVRDVKFASNTCVLGYAVSGIWPKGADGTDINALHRSHDQTLIATGDDFNCVNLFSYPALKGCGSKVYEGHSSHVTNARFSFDDQLLITTGGGDAAVFQWKVIPSTSPKTPKKVPLKTASDLTNSPKPTRPSPVSFKSEKDLRAQIEKEIRAQVEKELTKKLEKEIEARLRPQIEKELKKKYESNTASPKPTKTTPPPAKPTATPTKIASPKTTTSKPTVTPTKTASTPTKITPAMPSKIPKITKATPTKTAAAPSKESALEKRVDTLENEVKELKESFKKLAQEKE